jgi:uncharacterized protein involved in outer membrane biogenesis
MRRLLRALLVVLTLLVILIVGLLIAARAYLSSDSARREVAARLEAIYGGPVEVEGADIGLFGDSTLRNVRLHEAGQAGRSAWASAAAVKTDVSALDLLRGVMPRQITLTDPVVTLRLDRDGRLLTQLPEGRAPGAGAAPDITIEGGQVTVQQEGRPEMVVQGIRASVKPEVDRLTVTGDISDPEWGDWRLNASIDRADASMTATLTTDRAVVTQDKLLRLPVVPGAEWEEVEARGITAVEFTFRHDPGPRGVNHYRVVLHPDGMAITLPRLALTTEGVRGGITIEDGVIALTGVSGQALGGELDVDGTLDFRGQENVLHFVVRARGLDVRQVPEAWEFDERLRRLGGKLNGKADLTVRFDGEVRTTGEGSGEITDVMLGGKPTTIELRLRPTRKGFGFGQRPAQEGRLPSHEPGVPPTELLGALILLQAPPEPAPSYVRDVAAAIHGGLRAIGGAFLDVGRKAISSVPKGDLTKPAPAAAPPTYLDINLNLKDVDLAQLVKDLEVKLPFEVSGRLSMKVQASLPVDRAHDLKLYKVSGTATLPTFSLAGVEMKDVSARVQYADGVLRLEELRGRLTGGLAKDAKPGAGTFEGSARLGVVPEGELTADLKLTDVPLSQLAWAAGIREDVTGAVSGSADLRVPAGRLRDLSAWQGSARLSADRVGAYGWALTDAGATARVGNGLLTVRDVKGKLEGAAVTGSAEAKLTAPYSYEGKLELPKGDLASLQRLAPGLRPPVAVAGRFGITAEVNGTLSPLTAKLSGSGSGEDVKVEKVRVERLSFRWATADDVLKLTDVKAGLYSGTVTGSADVPLSAKREGKVDLRLDGVDVGDLVRDAPAVPLRLEGKAGGSIKGTLAAAAAGGERTFEGEVELSAPKLRVQNLPTEKLTGTISYRKGVGEYHLKGGLLGGTFELDGRIPPRPANEPAPPAKPEPPADSRLRIRGAQLGRLGEALGSRGMLEQLHGRVDVDVDFRLAGPEYVPVGTGRASVTRLRWGDTQISDSITSDIILGNGEARLRNLNGLVGGGTLRGQVVLRLRDLGRSFFNIALDGAEASRALAPWPSLAENVSGSLDARLRGTLGRRWQGGGDLILTRGKVLGVDVSEWRVPLRFDAVPERGRAEITVDDMSATVAHGRVTARGTFGVGPDTRVDGHLRFHGAELRALLRPFTENTQLGGGLASGRVEFSGSNVRSLDDVTATVDASFSQAQAFQMPVLSSLVPFIAPGRSTTTFQSGDLRGRLSNGIFRVQRLSLTGSAVNLFGEGTVTTAGRLNLDVTATTGVIGAGGAGLRLLGLRLPVAGPIPLSLLVEATSYFTNTSVHLIVGGTLRSPAIRIEPLSLLTEEAARFFLLRGGAPLP